MLVTFPQPANQLPMIQCDLWVPNHLHDMLWVILWLFDEFYAVKWLVRFVWSIFENKTHKFQNMIVALRGNFAHDEIELILL